MTNICSNIAGVVTRWVERKAPYAINTMAKLTYKAVPGRPRWQRMT